VKGKVNTTLFTKHVDSDILIVQIFCWWCHFWIY